MDEANVDRGGSGSFWLAALVPLLVLVVGAGFVVRDDDDSGSRVETAAGGEGRAEPGDFELLDLEVAHEPMGTVRAAADRDSYEELWNHLGLDGDAPEVDFGRWVVATFTIADDACPPALVRFEVDDAVWTPLFVEPVQDCVQPLIPKTFVVSVRRSELPSAVTFRLPAAYAEGYEGVSLDVPVATVPVGPDPVVPPPERTGALLGTVALPPRGDATSALLDDGMPVWVVRHDDGSVSAVPGVIPWESSGRSDAVDGLSGLWHVVTWLPSGAFAGPIAWDAHGRAITGGRQHDLSAFVGDVVDDEVHIYATAGGRLPGYPVLLEPEASSPRWPALPPLVSLEDLTEGWHRVDADIAGAGDTFRVCRVGETARERQPCPDDAPVLWGMRGRADRAVFLGGPLLLLVDDRGRIVGSTRRTEGSCALPCAGFPA